MTMKTYKDCMVGIVQNLVVEKGQKAIDLHEEICVLCEEEIYLRSEAKRLRDESKELIEKVAKFCEDDELEGDDDVYMAMLTQAHESYANAKEKQCKAAEKKRIAQEKSMSLMRLLMG